MEKVLNFAKMKRFLYISIIALTVLSCRNNNSNIPPCGTYSDGLLSCVTPTGWIREFLERQRTGLSGHPEAMSYPYNTCLWDGEIQRMSTHGAGWWRYEQTAYYSDGLIRLGYALRDTAFIGKIERSIQYTIDHATPEGRLGSNDILVEAKRFMWPQAVFFRAMKAMYDATGDERIPEALEKYYLSYNAEQIGALRNIVSIEGMLWTYGLTHNKKLVKLAREAYEAGEFELYPELAESEGCPHIHGVTYCEELKIPELLYAWTGDVRYKHIADSFHSKLVDLNMLPDGVPTSVEHVMGNSVEIGHETCDIADFTWTEGYFLMTEGAPVYADRIEKAVFNAAPGAMTKDFKAIQYFSNLNQFNVTGDSDPNTYRRGKTWNAYRPIHETECCIGNVHRIMPNYVSRMWLTDRDGGLVAALYGPSEVEYDGMKVEELTNYPFEGEIKFVFHTGKAGRRSFSFRIPGWCRNYSVSVNGKALDIKADEGKFICLKRCFRDGDTLALNLDMKARLTYPNGQGLAFERGPLLFAYHIPENWEEDKTDYANMRGKKSENSDFKCWSITPAEEFAYGLETSEVTEEKNDVADGSYPFDDPPYSLKVSARRIDWPLEEGKFTPRMPADDTKRLDDTTTVLELTPYGCSQLRLSVFPQLNHTPTRSHN